MQSVFHDFVEGVRESQSLDDLRAALSGAASAFDLSRFAYFSPATPNRASLFFSTYPTAWTDHYFNQRYELIDPVFTVACARMEPFRWGRDVASGAASLAQRQLFSEAAGFGIRNGLTVPLNTGRGTFAALTFAADLSDRAFDHTIERNRPALQLLAVVLQSSIRRKFLGERTVGGVALTRREAECLGWSAQGKSAWEIGRILGIGRRTAAFHIDNAKTKLGVRSICQAVALFAAATS